MSINFGGLQGKLSINFGGLDGKLPFFTWSEGMQPYGKRLSLLKYKVVTCLRIIKFLKNVYDGVNDPKIRKFCAFANMSWEKQKQN